MSIFGPMLTDSMLNQIHMDKTGNMWIKSVILRFRAVWNHPLDAGKRLSFMSDNWGLTK